MRIRIAVVLAVIILAAMLTGMMVPASPDWQAPIVTATCAPDDAHSAWIVRLNGVEPSYVYEWADNSSFTGYQTVQGHVGDNGLVTPKIAKLWVRWASDRGSKGSGAAQTTLCPTATPPPKPTEPEPTATPVPPTATPVPPTATPVPPTATPVPPTATPVPETETPVPPTATPPSNIEPDGSRLTVEGECYNELPPPAQKQPTFFIANKGEGDMLFPSNWYRLPGNVSAEQCASKIQFAVLSGSVKLDVGESELVTVDTVAFPNAPYSLCVQQQPGNTELGWAAATIDNRCAPTAEGVTGEPTPVWKLFMPSISH